MQGIALTGWSRYDHFSGELLPGTSLSASANSISSLLLQFSANFSPLQFHLSLSVFTLHHKDTSISIPKPTQSSHL
jgi:hypothetical protein